MDQEKEKEVASANPAPATRSAATQSLPITLDESTNLPESVAAFSRFMFDLKTVNHERLVSLLGSEKVIPYVLSQM